MNVFGLFTFRWNGPARMEIGFSHGGERFESLAIDPGLRNTGWGVIDSTGNSLRFVASGTVKSDNKLDLASRLNQLYEGLETVVHSSLHRPFEAAVENTFVNKDATATLKLGQARGIAMLAPARAGHAGGRICAQCCEEGRDRCRPWRQEADPDDGQDADPESDLSTATMPRMRWRLPSVTPITGHLRPGAWRRNEDPSMIGKLKGTIEEIDEEHVLIDVHGVCYVAFCSSRTLSRLGSAGEAVVLFIETYVREDQLKLFGFETALEREWFRLLQSVQGVGAKVALAVLSTLTASELANAIALQDKAMVARAPGIGPKVAQRIVTELKNKAPAFSGDAGERHRAKAGTGRGRCLRTGGRRRLGACPILATRVTRPPMPWLRQ
jgi:Holliday junction DNA helicase RuvA